MNCLTQKGKIVALNFIRRNIMCSKFVHTTTISTQKKLSSKISDRDYNYDCNTSIIRFGRKQRTFGDVLLLPIIGGCLFSLSLSHLNEDSPGDKNCSPITGKEFKNRLRLFNSGANDPMYESELCTCARLNELAYVLTDPSIPDEHKLGSLTNVKIVKMKDIPKHLHTSNGKKSQLYYLREERIPDDSTISFNPDGSATIDKFTIVENHEGADINDIQLEFATESMKNAFIAELQKNPDRCIELIRYFPNMLVHIPELFAHDDLFVTALNNSKNVRDTYDLILVKYRSTYVKRCAAARI